MVGKYIGRELDTSTDPLVLHIRLKHLELLCLCFCPAVWVPRSNFSVVDKNLDRPPPGFSGNKPMEYHSQMLFNFSTELGQASTGSLSVWMLIA